ncbi:MAG: hypothetical protein EWM47_10665 [Anaerolineaceae bacterium]|nr:MAG: hypothetical protein EWM47_10665 [Anaerolineaceae bacterium]
MSILIPVNAEEFSIALYDNCWDSAADIPHLKVNSATAIYGSIVGGEAKEEAPAVVEDNTPAIPAFDPNGTYHAYLSVQSENFIFRNQWADPDFGPNGGTWEKHSIGNNFNGLTGWDGPNAVAYDGAFTDVEIKGNGTYQVSLRDFDFGNDSAFNLLYLSTDIPMEGNPLTFTDVKVIMNGNTKYTFDQGIIPGIDTKDAKDYYEVHCINIWNNDQLGGKEGLFSNNIPSSSIALEFTVSGFAYDKAVEEVVEEEVDLVEDVKDVEDKVEDDTSSQETISEEDSWIKSNWILVAIIAAVVVAVIIVVVVIRMKGKKEK